MLTLHRNRLQFRLPEVHPKAELDVFFQRTLRIPDDGKSYPLPPGLDTFPLRLVDDLAETVPALWIDHGGVMLPMYQSEALWINFYSGSSYPFALKIATGKINAVTGEAWTDRPQVGPQDFVVTSEQPWLDGFSVEEGMVRQFVAMPLGSGYSAEEQLTGSADVGGLQLIAYPMKAEFFERSLLAPVAFEDEGIVYSAHLSIPDMGLAPGGLMRQEIYEDPHGLDAWDLEHPVRCFVHIANSLVWRQITGAEPPGVPFTAHQYTEAGLPWFEYYDETATALPGSDRLKGLDSVAQRAEKTGDNPLPENESVTADRIVELRRGLRKNEVRQTRF